MRLKIALILSLIICSTLADKNPGPTAKIKNGILNGIYMKSKYGRTFHGFLGIPYAQPPTGELRFEPPLPANNWSGSRDATKDNAQCPQPALFEGIGELNINEDCLFLNVFTPTMPGVAHNSLPVMVFIHGGAFYAGSGNTKMYGPDLLMDKEIVLVTINYRLGALGYLSTGDEVVPGNNGMKDQILALKWVQANIKSFGGDPKRVTIFGESAGGGSTHLLMVSPLSKGLFQTVISQSGTALNDWACRPKKLVKKYSKKLAELLDCPSENSKKLVECLKKKSAEEIIGTHKKFIKFELDPLVTFGPVVESQKGGFLPDHPAKLIENGLANDVTWIVGLTTEEGLLRSAAIYKEGNEQQLDYYNKNREKLLPETLMLIDSSKDDVKKMLKFYLGGEPMQPSNFDQFTNLLTDAVFLYGTEKAISLHLKYLKSPVYYYLFGYRGTTTYATLVGGSDDTPGVCHADDLLYLFPIRRDYFGKAEPTESENHMDDIMTTLWSNIATYQNPTPENWTGVKWQAVSSDKQEYYYIGDAATMSMKKEMFAERSKFWKELYGKRDYRKEEL